MPGVKSERIRADRIAEMLRVIKLHPEITTGTLAKMFSTSSAVISSWKRKSGLLSTTQ
jgi:hypothetical protein